MHFLSSVINIFFYSGNGIVGYYCQQSHNFLTANAKLIHINKTSFIFLINFRDHNHYISILEWPGFK